MADGLKGGTGRDGAWRVFLIFLGLGLTSFGGPAAHVGYFREAFVVRRRWLSERSYADLVALCQFLPGPASSQIGMALGLSRAGYRGALAAWLGFTLPSALLLILFALSLSGGWQLPGGALHGLKVVAVAVVAQAVWSMARTLCTGWKQAVIALMAMAGVLAWSGTWVQVGVMVAAGAAGALWLSAPPVATGDLLPVRTGRRTGIVLLLIFALLLAGLPLLAVTRPDSLIAVIDAFYRAGALVFGGGHVVLPLLQSAVVTPGWVDSDSFLAGYGAAQGIPGPLFSFAAFLGAAMEVGPSGWIGGLLCLVVVFLPSFLLVAGVLPFWAGLRANRRARAALAGVNAGVVGLLAAVLYDPMWTSSIRGLPDLALAAMALVMLAWWRWPAWLVVVVCGGVGAWVGL